ncbi:hypothetical protein [Haloactinomyces albus]|uniref:Uncharacterized protein n=1 Tax=Haloactinomyces albus TaxID=1352928 RepID=A0AAE3ZAX6_9ACTN|nr:hypothetical protein [Haloactinomyces albus]MDR7300530.1 hypothetical protein [Haloactinomyces albus]
MVIAELALLPDRRELRRLDALVAVWTLVFLALGIVAGIELWQLSGLSHTLRQTSSAIQAAGRGIALFERVPLIGTEAGSLAQTIRDTAVSLRVGAAQAGSTARVLSVVIGLALVLMGVAPLVVVYLPLRLIRLRETRSLARSLGTQADPLLIEHLARTAVFRLPYSRLRRITPTPWRDLEQGIHHRLAAAELRRLGVSVPSDWPRHQE